MKRLVWGMIFLLMISFVSASYTPTPALLFEYKKSNCTNGTLTFDVTHEGVTVAYKDLNITVKSDDLKEMPLRGDWYYPDNYKIPENYTGSDFTSKLLIRYKATTQMFTKGKYIVGLRWPSNTVYNENIQFAAECQGIRCEKDNDCILQQKCTDNICEWVKCDETQYAIGHRCFQKCEDYNSCTTDYFIDNQCIHIEIDNCCNNDGDCEINQICENKACKGITSKFNFIKKFWNWLKSLNK